MAVISAEVEHRLSTKSGSAGDTTTSTGPEALGKYISTTVVPAGLHGLFDVISPAEDAASDIEYRCVFIHHTNGTDTLSDVKVWLTAESTNAGIDIGLDPAGIVTTGQAGAQAAEIADEGTAPAGVTFSNPVTKGTGLAVGNLGPNQCHAIWIRRTAPNLGASSTENFTIRSEGTA